MIVAVIISIACVVLILNMLARAQMFRPQRFWGHPDDWDDKAWDEANRIGFLKRWIWGMDV